MNTKSNLTPYFGTSLSVSNVINSKVEGRHAFITSVNGPREEYITTSNSTIVSRTFFSGTAAIGTTYRISDKQEILFQLRYEHGRYSLLDSGSGIDESSYLSNRNNSIYLTAAYIIK